MMAVPEEITIAIVDDSENDTLTIRRAVQAAQPRNRIVAIEGGQEALDYLQGSGKYSNREEYPLPGLILLDLKLPKFDGFEVLTWIRRQSQFKDLPVVVLTSSELLFDVTKAYDLGANSYLVKPTEFENLDAMMRTLGSVWKQKSQPPIRPPPANPHP